MRLINAPASQVRLVRGLRRRSLLEDGMQAVGQRSEDCVGENDRYRENEGEMLSAESRQDADRRRTPDCGCRIETPDIRTVLKNHACAEVS